MAYTLGSRKGAASLLTAFHWESCWWERTRWTWKLAQHRKQTRGCLHRANLQPVIDLCSPCGKLNLRFILTKESWVWKLGYKYYFIAWLHWLLNGFCRVGYFLTPKISWPPRWVIWAENLIASRQHCFYVKMLLILMRTFESLFPILFFQKQGGFIPATAEDHAEFWCF